MNDVPHPTDDGGNRFDEHDRQTLRFPVGDGYVVEGGERTGRVNEGTLVVDPTDLAISLDKLDVRDLPGPRGRAVVRRREARGGRRGGGGLNEVWSLPNLANRSDQPK